MSSHSPSVTLKNLEDTLHLLHHRNKNQHRLAKWYKSLSQFRRQIPKLVSEFEAYYSARAIKEESVYVVKARESLIARISFVRERLIGRWYLYLIELAASVAKEGPRTIFFEMAKAIWEANLFVMGAGPKSRPLGRPSPLWAFSNVVADNQYAALGLMLVGSLARFRSVLNIIGREVDIEEDDLEEELDEPALQPEELEAKVDVGEVIERTAFEDLHFGGKVRGKEEDGNVEDDKEVTPRKSLQKEKKKRKQVIEAKEAKAEPTPTKRPKKKRKKGDAFDDLFDSLM
ncbi:hypothetical protein G7Y89_g3506 [Cudoniella acicularis]|uniref:RNase MRP protein 1 RNA binding domain-containing protein n=1 Tax=Cudoniella acicularis TaxID=354080 RepID=A0A8H4RS36_9HELO|nr:hypothetical protein G7Y89_g3506 [Cudoniella acicularis]